MGAQPCQDLVVSGSGCCHRHIGFCKGCISLCKHLLLLCQGCPAVAAIKLSVCICLQLWHASAVRCHEAHASAGETLNLDWSLARHHQDIPDVYL